MVGGSSRGGRGGFGGGGAAVVVALVRWRGGSRRRCFGGGGGGAAPQWSAGRWWRRCLGGRSIARNTEASSPHPAAAATREIARSRGAIRLTSVLLFDGLPIPNYGPGPGGGPGSNGTVWYPWAMRIYVEPYFTGSHRQWAEGLARHSRHDIHLITHQGQFWKWRLGRVRHHRRSAGCRGGRNRPTRSAGGVVDARPGPAGPGPADGAGHSRRRLLPREPGDLPRGGPDPGWRRRSG